MRSQPTDMRGWGLTVLRVVLGIVFVAHGAQKLFMNGLDGTTGFFASLGIPLPMIAAIVITALELLGGLALIAGVFTRWVAILFALNMLVAPLLVHLPNGFFAADGGVGLTLVLLGGSVALALAGAGEASIDALLRRRTARASAPG